MKTKTSNILLFIGILIGGISYWFNPYNDMYLFGIHIYKIMGFGAFSSSLAITFLTDEKSKKIAFLITLGVLISVILRIVFDIIKDPTSHNLFPFEIVFALAITLLSVFSGSYTTKLIQYLKAK